MPKVDKLFEKQVKPTSSKKGNTYINIDELETIAALCEIMTLQEVSAITGLTVSQVNYRYTKFRNAIKKSNEKNKSNVEEDPSISLKKEEERIAEDTMKKGIFLDRYKTICRTIDSLTELKQKYEIQLKKDKLIGGLNPKMD